MQIEVDRPDRSLKLIYGQELYNKILNSNVLIGGSGGVGCEIIKNLSKTGFRNFTLIDLDTIELTNLNRQFYFRKHHVGKAKSECAKQGVLEVEPGILRVEAILGNIYDEKFNDIFYKQYNIAFCAFDNQGARRHFGKKCIANNIPMVEAGTSAFNGDVSSRIKGMFECRNCKPETKQVTFNVCSIRTRPSEPIHCIVWASNMYNLIFGPQDEQNEYMENYIQDIFKEGIKNITNPVDRCHMLFDKIFNEDIQKCDEKIRFPLSFQDAQQINNVQDAVSVDKKTHRLLIDDEKIFTVQQYSQKFISTFMDIFNQRKKYLGELKFDKDDQLAIKFVATISNLRTYNFRNLTDPKNKLQYLSEHKIKQMAGNIIPAIASTNSIVSAIQVNEAIKLMNNAHINNPKLLSEYLVQNDNFNKITPAVQCKPDIQCPVCSPANCYINLTLNCNEITLGELKQYFEEKYMAENQIIKCGSNVYYDPCQTSLIPVFQKQFIKKVSEIKDFNPIQTKFLLYNLQNQINWEFNVYHNDTLPRLTIQFDDENSHPLQIKQQQIKFIKEKHQDDLKQKMSIFQRFQYI